MRKFRMDKNTGSLAPGTWTAGWNLVLFIPGHDVCTGGPGLCKNHDAEGVEGLRGIMMIKLGSPKASDVPSYDTEAVLATNVSHTTAIWHRYGDRGPVEGERPRKDRGTRKSGGTLGG